MAPVLQKCSIKSVSQNKMTFRKKKKATSHFPNERATRRATLSKGNKEGTVRTVTTGAPGAMLSLEAKCEWPGVLSTH